MSHESHHDNAHHSTENKPKTALNSAFWFVLILALLFIAAVNFVKIMGHDEGHEGHGAEATHTEHVSGGHEATEHEGHGAAAEEHHSEAAAPADTAHEAAHH